MCEEARVAGRGGRREGGANRVRKAGVRALRRPDERRLVHAAVKASHIDTVSSRGSGRGRDVAALAHVGANARPVFPGGVEDNLSRLGLERRRLPKRGLRLERCRMSQIRLEGSVGMGERGAVPNGREGEEANYYGQATPQQ